jgi:large subunit ribosomal protein L28
MTKRCQITGKGPRTGNHVSHANNKTKRRFLPNLQHHKIWVEELGHYVHLRITANALRTIDKIGVVAAIAKAAVRNKKL